MGNFLHRVTKRVYRSIPPNELPEPLATYIAQPDLAALDSVPSRYWKITGDVVSEMSTAEKSAVDLVILNTSRDGAVSEVDEREGTLRQILMVLIDEINVLRQLNALPNKTFGQIRNQLRSGYGS